MGLDNGIILRKRRNQIKNIKEIEAKHGIAISPTWDNEEIELAYWRKCWNIREAVFDAIRAAGHDPKDDEFTFFLNGDTLRDIAARLREFNKKNWSGGDGWGRGSIWTWSEISKHLPETIRTLQWAASYKDANPDTEIYFYDSY